MVQQPKRPMPTRPDARRETPKRFGPRTLAELAAPDIAAALKAQGFASTEIVTRWDEIVGPELAGRCRPARISWARRAEGLTEAEPGTLHIRVEAPFALEVQHLSPVIVERVNAFFGWRCVAAIRLTQVPLSRKPKPKPAPPPADEAKLTRATSGVDDEALRTALTRLGRGIGGSRRA
ncbi:MAG: DciA family protein [Alphaproteobacteria bacterium]